MNSTDPRGLILLIEEAQHALTRVTADNRAAIDGAAGTQRLMSEHVSRLHQRLGALAELVEHDSRLSAALSRDVETARIQVDEAHHKAAHVESFAKQTLLRTERAQAHWEYEVDRATKRVAMAEAWVARAAARVRNAETWVSGATAERNAARNSVEAAEAHVGTCEHRLARAHSSLQDAETALAQCESSVSYRTDSHGNTHAVRPDCSGYRSAVFSAQRAVSAAESALRIAKSELASARKRLAAAEKELANARAELAAARHEFAQAQSELTDAREDLRLCRIALAKARMAVRLALESVEHANRALSHAAEGRVAIVAAQVESERVQADNDTQGRLIADLNLIARQAGTFLESGELESRAARSHGIRVADFARAGDTDLAARVDKLIELERTYDFT